jgi:hypothetical protein
MDPITGLLIAGGIKGLASIGGAILGKKKAPEAIALEPVDFAETSQEALDVSLGNLDEIEQLVTASSEITDEQTIASLERLIPGYRELQNKLVGFATDKATNPYELPSEIVDQLARVSAERGFVSGVDVRSGVGSFDLLRNLGITSLEFGRQNIQDATSIFGQVRQATPIYSPLNPASLFTTPGEVTAVRQRENDINQQILQSAENTRVAIGNENRQAVADAFTNSIGSITGQLAQAGYFGRSPAAAPAPAPAPVI